jgi:hypothetical protein
VKFSFFAPRIVVAASKGRLRKTTQVALPFNALLRFRMVAFSPRSRMVQGTHPHITPVNSASP